MAPVARAMTTSVLCALALCGCATAPPSLPYGGYDTVDPRWLEQPQNIPGFGRLFDGIGELGQAFVHASLPCREQLVTATVRIRGTVATRQINTSLQVALDAATSRLRLGSLDTTTPPIDLVATYPPDLQGSDDGSLVVPARRWVVRSHSRELIQLVLGVPLSARDLQSVLTGCPTALSGTLSFEVFDSRTVKMVVTAHERAIETYMRRLNTSSPWRVFAIIDGVPGRTTRWRVDPGRRRGGVLESVHLMSLEWNGSAGRLFDLTFSLDRIQTPQPTPDMFTLTTATSANDLPIDAVRLNVSVPLLAD